MLQKLVADCPLISLGLKAAALRLIVGALNNKARTADWETNEQTKGAEEHVILLTARYFAQAGLGATPGADSPDEVLDSLLSYLYGDYVTTRREANLALRKLPLSAQDPLRVPILFCLALGTGSLYNNFNHEDLKVFSVTNLRKGFLSQCLSSALQTSKAI